MAVIVLACKPVPTPIRFRKVTPMDLKKAIIHAQNICFNYEDTLECQDAWDIVDKLTEIQNAQSVKFQANSEQ